MSQFYFSRELRQLRLFYASMKKQKIDIGTFEHKYNNIKSDVILDTSQHEWKLIFIKRKIGDTLIITVKKGFKFTIESDVKYKEFIKYFCIAGGKGQFSINEFHGNLDRQIDSCFVLSDAKREIISSHISIESAREGFYPIGTKNWQLFHAQHPEIPKDKFHRSEENLKKTKQLYPNIYEATKDLDVTICYGNKPGNKTEEMRLGKYDWTR